ncbi:endopeptidase La [soil metagenome]
MPPSLTLPERIPVLPIRSTIVFPGGATALQIGYAPNVQALLRHPGPELVLATVWTADEQERLDPTSLEKIGTAVRALDRLNLPGGTIQATLQGLWRIHLEDVRFEEGMYSATPRLAYELAASPQAAEQLIEEILGVLGGLAARLDRIPDEVPRILRMNLADPSRFADLVASLCNLKVADRDATLQELDVAHRLDFVLKNLRVTWEQINARPPEGSEKREPNSPAEIRKRIQLLQAQLGESDPVQREGIQLLRQIESAELPAAAAAAGRREAERLASGSASPSEATEIRGYLEALLGIPWSRPSPAADVDLPAVLAAMDAAVIDLEEPKQRILEVLSVGRLRGEWDGLMPCMVGPPSVGKRALIEAVARGMGRSLARVELGGRGEAQLFGARRGQPGAQLGRIAAALRDAGVADPLFLLEELDEIGLGNVQGDPVDALEHMLKPQPQRQLTDRYLETDVPLSGAVFFATALDFLRVPRDLRELFIPISVPGYTPEEKVAIARERVLPGLAVEHGLQPDEVQLSDEMLLFLTRGYAREAGLGSLRRVLSALLRAAAFEKASIGKAPAALTPERISEVLGPPRYASTPAEQAPEIGVVTGLAWTASGGELLFIEALRMPGTGELRVTGSIGGVMRESVNAAFSYVRSRAGALGIARTTFKTHDVHVHFPAGATPKDGPSAGVAVTLAIASSLAERPVRHDIAMTGEVTLRGRVLEIGGVKEKVLAAYRAGMREVILPRGNERDLRDVPREVAAEMNFHLLERMDEVLELALLPRRRGQRQPRANPGGGATRIRQAATGHVR